MAKLGEPNNLTDLVRKTGDVVKDLLGPDDNQESADDANTVTVESDEVSVEQA